MISCTNCKHSVTCNDIKEDYHDCSQWDRKDNLSLVDYMKKKLIINKKGDKTMKVNEYQELAMRTNDGGCTGRALNSLNCGITSGLDIGGVINGCMGLSGEAGELQDHIKKAVFHGHDLDNNYLQKELGDILWYIALLCDSFGFDMEEIMEQNIAKLQARYPEGFSEEASQNRVE